MKSALRLTVWRDRDLKVLPLSVPLEPSCPRGLTRVTRHLGCRLADGGRARRAYPRHAHSPRLSHLAGASDERAGGDRNPGRPTYSRKDFEHAPALELNPGSHIYSVDRRPEDGTLILQTEGVEAQGETQPHRNLRACGVRAVERPL